MLTVLMIISVLLIILVLLQSGKAESGNIISGGNADLFMNRAFYNKINLCSWYYFLCSMHNNGYVIKRGL